MPKQSGKIYYFYFSHLTDLHIHSLLHFIYFYVTTLYGYSNRNVRRRRDERSV